MGLDVRVEAVTTHMTDAGEKPIDHDADPTVKAIAVKDGVASAVASKTFTKSEGGDDEPGGDDH